MKRFTAAALLASTVAWSTAVNAEEEETPTSNESSDVLAPGTPTRPVELSRLVADLRRGENIGRFKQGVICMVGGPLTWRSGGQLEIDTEEFDEAFRDELERIGYTVAGDPDNLFENTGDSGSEFLIGGRIKHIDMKICYPMGGFGDYDTSKGEASITVEWQVYSKLDRRVVGTQETTGSIKSGSQNGGAYAILLSAFADSVRQLASTEGFKKIFVGSPADMTVARQAPIDLTPIQMTATPVRPIPISDTVGSTVLVFAGEGHGSGFLVSQEGHVLTNAHVVGAAKYLKIRWADGSETLGEVLRVDPGRDVAVLKTDASGRLPLAIRKTSPLVGEDVYAVGAPLDQQLQSTVTRGIVSATRVVDGYSYIQSDVSVNGGNSGGPLLDRDGNVIGLTAAGLTRSGVPLGINLFIPISEAEGFLGLQAAAP